MILIIDNYDSFTYNLVQRLGEIDANIDLLVRRNDQITLDEISELAPQRIIISPGPCTPKEAGISVACVQKFSGRCPILGVCLGHQAIGQAYGASIVRAKRLMHGKTDAIHHDQQGIFSGLETPLIATRYHSLVIEPGSLPNCFVVSAWSQLANGDQEIMAIRHRSLPVIGVQFHPESFLTEAGPAILRQFLTMR
jgi:anthranilate synthase component 2